MRTLWTSRHFSSATPPAGDVPPEEIVEDANLDSGTPSFFFLGLVVAGVLLLFWLVTPQVDLRSPIGEYAPEVDPAVDAYALVDAETGTYRVPVAGVMAKMANDSSMLAPIPPRGGFVEIDTSTPEGMGAKHFAAFGCNACHSVDGGTSTGPTLAGIFGREEALEDDSTITVDEPYLRESILEPSAKIVKGYASIPMVFVGTPTEDQVTELVAYLKSL